MVPSAKGASILKSGPYRIDLTDDERHHLETAARRYPSPYWEVVRPESCSTPTTDWATTRSPPAGIPAPAIPTLTAASTGTLFKARQLEDGHPAQ
jgi:hypothetical protein